MLFIYFFNHQMVFTFWTSLIFSEMFISGLSKAAKPQTYMKYFSNNCYPTFTVLALTIGI
jgi:hypothetical protein